MIIFNSDQQPQPTEKSRKKSESNIPGSKIPTLYFETQPHDRPKYHQQKKTMTTTKTKGSTIQWRAHPEPYINIIAP